MCVYIYDVFMCVGVCICIGMYCMFVFEYSDP